MPLHRIICLGALILMGTLWPSAAMACTIQASPDTTICRGDTVTMWATGGGPYSWAYSTTPGTPFSTDSVVRLVLFFNTTFFVSSPCGQDTVVVTVRNPPQVTFGGNPHLCPGGTLVMDAQSVGDYYVWNTGDSSQTILIRNPGWYSVTVTNACGSSSDSIFIPLMPPSPVSFIPPDTVVCPGEPVTLQVAGTLDTLWWSTGNTAQSITVSDSGTYIVYASNACGSIRDTFILHHYTPYVDAGADTCICEGEVVQLSPGSGYSGFQWAPSALLDDASIERPTTVPLSQSTTFTLQAIDLNGCPASDTVHVCLMPLPVVDAGPDTLIEFGQAVQLWAIGATNYRWAPATRLDDPNVPDPMASPQTTTQYMVTGTDSNGCQNTAQVLLEVHIPPQRIWAPTAFSPNGDGRNDLFHVVADGLFELREYIIFDRWGQAVFRGLALSDTWDGTLGGIPQPIGAYVVYLRLWDTIEGREVMYKANVTLVR